MVAYRMTLVIGPVLRKDATQINLAGPGCAVGGLLAPSAPLQRLRPHGHARAESPLGVEDGHRTSAPGWASPFLPALGRRTDPLHHALNLAGGHRNAAGLGQMSLGF